MNRIALGALVGITAGAATALWNAPATLRGADTQPSGKELLADIDRHAEKLTRSLPKNYSVRQAGMFFIASNDTPEQVALGEKTVEWTVAHLKKDFFEKEPASFIDVYLFKDKASYEAQTKQLFNQTPDTPYGFAAGNAIYVNFATGGGTLVHEMVHTFIAANVTKCPAWLNEGLASLFEESMDKNGHIVGLVNWRVEPLKKTLAGKGPQEEGPAPSFKDLCAMDAATFYGKGRIPNYGAARYLLLYLQEQGVLVQFYKDFIQRQKEDPTGYDTLRITLAGIGEIDMEAFRKKWEAWVAQMKSP